MEAGQGCNAIKTRQPGPNGRTVCALGPGCMGLSFGHGPAAGKQCEELVPIPGATKLEHLDDNLPAADLELTTSDLAEIDAAFAAIPVEGAPLSPEPMAGLDR